MLLVGQVVLTLVMIYVGLTTLHNLHTMIRLPCQAGPASSLPLVSVLIPARNETLNISACLEAVLSQDYPRFEVFVLDDDSSDDTAVIIGWYAAADPRLRLLRGAPLPEDWQGKSWACHQLYGQARGEWLLFLDADARSRRDTISSAVAAAYNHHLDLLSLGN